MVCSCTTRESSVEPTDRPKRSVRVLFAPDKIGDSSFNDNILSGILKEQQNNDFQLHVHYLNDMSKADSTVRAWMTEENENVYTVFAGSEFESSVRKAGVSDYHSDYLIFDTPSRDLPMSAFHFCGYGASYLAGIAAFELTQANSAVCLGAYPGEAYVNECFDGFKDGFMDSGGKMVEVIYMMNSTEGYSKPERAYEMADSLSRIYPFMYAMTGGANMGIYQFLRENPDADMHTLGVIVDQQNYSDRIIGSIMTEIGACAGNAVRLWSEGVQVEPYQQFGLESEYIWFKVADRYMDRIGIIINQNKAKAIMKENEYESLLE